MGGTTASGVGAAVPEGTVTGSIRMVVAEEGTTSSLEVLEPLSPCFCEGFDGGWNGIDLGSALACGGRQTSISTEDCPRGIREVDIGLLFALVACTWGFFPFPLGGRLGECLQRRVASGRMGMVWSSKMVWLRRGKNCSMLLSSRRAFEKRSDIWFFTHYLMMVIQRNSSEDAVGRTALLSGTTLHMA